MKSLVDYLEKKKWRANFARIQSTIVIELELL